MTSAQQIDSFLHNHKSPMAGMGKVFVAAGRKYGVDPSLVVAISGIESSFGKHAFRPHNAWGWMGSKGWGSWEEGITTVTKGLRSGYIDRGLTTPDQIVHRYAPASDGNDTDNWVRVVNQYYGELGGAKKSAKTQAMSPVPVTNPAMPKLPTLPPFDPSAFIRQTSLENLADIAQGGKVDASDMLTRSLELQANVAAGKAQHAAQEEWLATQVPKGPAVYNDPEGAGGSTKGGKAYTYDGKLLQPGTRWKGTHVTDNMDWNHGRKTAVDIMAAAGTPVGAPMDGTIVYFHPTGAQGGGSMLFRALDGTEFWLGHIAHGQPAGTKVSRGQPIAAIAQQSVSAPHLHIDRKW